MYQVLGYADTCGAAMLHETDDYNEAKSWVAGYVLLRWSEPIRMGGDPHPKQRRRATGSIR